MSISPIQFVIEDITDIGYTVNKRYRLIFTLETNLTEIPISLTAARMGRPPLNRKSDTKPTLVRLTVETRAAIEAIVGPNRMAEFIREAIEREIKRRSRKSDKPE